MIFYDTFFSLLNSNSQGQNSRCWWRLTPKTPTTAGNTLIYNAFGQLIKIISLDSPRQSICLSVSNLPSGIYYAQINHETIKFVIVR